MLHILDDKNGQIGSFKTYGELIGFIHKSQIYLLKRSYASDHAFVDGLDEVDTRWLFFCYKHSGLAAIYSSINQPPMLHLKISSL